MFWSSYNLSFTGSPNHSAYSAPNHAAYGAPNHAAYGAPNHAAYGAPNHAAYGAPNHAAYGAPNHAAYAAPNHAAYAAGAAPVMVVTPPPGVANGTGAGGASGTGFLGGYGPVARFEYATPAGLGPIPWVLDYATGDGWPPFPPQEIDPEACTPRLRWQPADWDPALRFWALPFDPHLTEWLQDLNLAAPAVAAAREFAGQASRWLAADPDRPPKDPTSALHAAFELGGDDLFAWRNGWDKIQRELDELADLMRDDRARYLEELAVQSGQSTPYFVHLMGFDPATKPWTMELMNCATAIGNLVKMQYKSQYRRVRPSTLRPGLLPPWGPPRHPAFPSGHSTVAHLTALLLLSIPGVAQRFGVFAQGATIGHCPEPQTLLGSQQVRYGHDHRSPLLWLAWRIARGRERLGLHYRSDSAAGRRLAGLVWVACLQLAPEHDACIDVPALREVLRHATAEWPLLRD